MKLTSTEQSLLLATWYRGMPPEQRGWTSSSDQIVTLSLFFTGDISAEDCQHRFSVKSHVDSLYNDDGLLRAEIAMRYYWLIRLLRNHAGLIEGGATSRRRPIRPTRHAA